MIARAPSRNFPPIEGANASHTSRREQPTAKRFRHRSKQGGFASKTPSHVEDCRGPARPTRSAQRPDGMDAARPLPLSQRRHDRIRRSPPSPVWLCCVQSLPEKLPVLCPPGTRAFLGAFFMRVLRTLGCVRLRRTGLGARRFAAGPSARGWGTRKRCVAGSRCVATSRLLHSRPRIRGRSCNTPIPLSPRPPHPRSRSEQSPSAKADKPQSRSD